jgi:hypothetical protein
MGLPTTRPDRAAAQDACMSRQRIIRVSLEAQTGERWDAIGGGESVEEAIGFAVESAPNDRRWSVVEWRDVFGD